MNALVVIETLTPAIFSEEGGIDAMLSKLEADVRSVATDISTPKGRKEIASLAHKVARSKTAFDSLGKDLAAEWKTKAKAIDTERSRVWDRLEALQAEVRKPLDEYEAAEAKRLADHQNAIQTIIDLGTFSSESPLSGYVVDRLKALDSLPDRDWQEFKQPAAKARSDTFAKLQALKGTALAREAEAADLARLRAAELAREQQEREDRIAAAAAAHATREAEERAETARLKADREKVEAIAAQKRAEAETARVQEAAERDRVAMELAVEANRLIAIENERQRVAAIAKAEADETTRREADKAHRKSINSEALKALVVAGLTVEQGVMVVTAIVRGHIPHIKISY
jgi:hypothetical protein